MAEATWTDIEKRKLEDRLRFLEAQVKRVARLSDKRSTGAKFYIPEDQVQIDGDVTIEGDLDVNGALDVAGGATITDPLTLIPGPNSSSINFETLAGRSKSSLVTAGTVNYDDLLVQAGDVDGLPGRLFLAGQGTGLGSYMARLILDAYNSIATLFVTDASGTGKIEVTSSGVQLNDTGATIGEFSTDGTMAGNSDAAVPTEKAVKTYVDGQAHDMVLIETKTRATNGTITFTSIPQTYKHLRLIGHVRGTHGAASDNLAIRFNNSSAAVYDDCFIAGLSDGTMSAGGNIGATSARVVHINSAASPSNDFTTIDITVGNYADTSANKAFSTGTGGANNGSLTLMVMLWGQWGSTAAVTRIDLFGTLTTSLLAGSTVSLYGVKG